MCDWRRFQQSCLPPFHTWDGSTSGETWPIAWRQVVRFLQIRKKNLKLSLSWNTFGNFCTNPTSHYFKRTCYISAYIKVQYTFLSSNHCEGSQKVSLNFSFPIFFHSCCTSFLPIFPFVLICLAFCPSFLSSFAPYLFYISSFKLLKMEYKWRHCLNKSALDNKMNLAF